MAHQLCWRWLWILVLILALLPAGCQPVQAPADEMAGTDAYAASALPANPMPLGEAAPLLQPQAVWTNFYALTQVPRPSHHEEQASAFLAKFGRDLGLETIVDEVGNVLIRKPATPGMEDRAGVILQAHMDMVAQKTPESSHNFETDPIDAYVQDGWVKAHGTTLGADDGSGVAIIMALLQAQDFVHGPLEALFTVNEEDGFGGVNNLKPSLLQGTLYINVDSEDEGVFTIGSAGGAYVDATAAYTEEPVDAGMTGFEIAVSGLTGGHSGVDIGENRGNAGLLLVRLLWQAEQQFGLRLFNLDGGDRYNAIPRNATALVAVPNDQAEAFGVFVKQYAATVKSEYAMTEPGLQVQARPVELPAHVMPTAQQTALLSALYGIPNGVDRMSDSVPNLVETSVNLGILTIGGGAMHAGHYVRSAVDSERDALADRLVSIYTLAGADTVTSGHYSGWPPNPNSPIVLLMQAAYRDEFGKEAELNAVHAGLETSVVGAIYPDMSMISVGPTLVAVHSPDERMEVATVGKVYDLLVATLARVE